MAFSTAYRRWPELDLTRYNSSNASAGSSSSSSSSSSGSKNYRVLATSAASSYGLATKREYCADYKPLAETLTLKHIGVQVAKAVVLTFATGMQEYNAYLDKLIAQQNAEDAGKPAPPVPDFDWGAARIKYWAQFTTSANRFVSTYVLRRLYESWAVAKLTARAADRLCKDVLKSLKRKLARGGASRVRACANVVLTAFYANLTVYAAALTYDVITFVPATVNVTSKRRGVNIEITLLDFGTDGALLWLNKKIVFYSVSAAASAVGFALGAYFHVEYGSIVGQTVFETVASVAAAGMLGI